MTEEQMKKAISEIENAMERWHLGRDCDDETLEGILVEEFASAKEAHIKYGFSVKYIGLCCNGKIKKYKNYEWKFK